MKKPLSDYRVVSHVQSGRRSDFLTRAPQECKRTHKESGREYYRFNSNTFALVSLDFSLVTDEQTNGFDEPCSGVTSESTSRILLKYGIGVYAKSSMANLISVRVRSHYPFFYVILKLNAIICMRSQQKANKCRIMGRACLLTACFIIAGRPTRYFDGPDYWQSTFTL
jgi:hypothetical protein